MVFNCIYNQFGIFCIYVIFGLEFVLYFVDLVIKEFIVVVMFGEVMEVEIQCVKNMIIFVVFMNLELSVVVIEDIG